jgi:hypothetical protein
MIRPLHPTDMPSYMAFARRACCGEGIERCSEGLSSLRFLDFLGRSLALDTPLQTWVYTRNRAIIGLVSAKARRGAAVWEVDRWVGSDTPDTELALESLLEHLAVAAGEEGVQRIFLRLRADSDLIRVARRAGFHVYCTERIYRSTQREPLPVAAPPPLRLRRSFDYHPLFHHYLRSVPARVRQAEGMTLQEWRWVDGWQPRRQWQLGLPRHQRDYVYENEGRISSWLRLDSRRGSASLSVEPGSASGRLAEHGLLFALSNVPASRPVFVPTRDYQGPVEDVLLDQNFESVGEYALTVRLLAVRVSERLLMPVGV